MEIITNTTVLLTISIGFCGFLLFYILKLLRNEQAARSADNSKKGPDKSEPKKIQNSGGGSMKNRKRPVDKLPNSKPSQWLLTTLKGHTGQVLNIDITTNNKYLASCSEDSVDNCDNSTTITTTTTTTTTTTRKQKIIDKDKRAAKIKRKRRRKKRTNKITTTTTTITIDKTSDLITTKTMLPLKEYTILCNYLIKTGYNPVNDLNKLFERYLLTQQDQYEMGYPLYSSNHVQFYHHYNNYHQQQQHVKIYRPSIEDDDSGRSSGNSSDTESTTSACTGDDRFINVLHKCVRCAATFSITNNCYSAEYACIYHHGKLVNVGRAELRYNCCYGYKHSYGCTTQPFHVYNGYNYGWNGPFFDYFTINHQSTDNNCCIYGIDCEMCYTTQGLEVTKLTIVNIDGQIVYNTLIRPYNTILDFNTRYSGITPNTFQENHANLKTLKQVQNDLRLLIGANTIIIGHGLENDLRCLKFVHNRCIDTVKLFPHEYGLPYRNSLKNLVNQYLKRTIQNSQHLGHDSYEDACASIELVLWKIRKDLQRHK